MSREQVLRVEVPATSANLGAGFDVLGIALNLHNAFRVALASHMSIRISGYGTGLPADDTNLFCVAFRHLYSLAGKPAPPVSLAMCLDVPQGKGLGSSATAVVGGLVAANTLLGNPFGDEVLVREATRLERGHHADNVAPALLGGLVVNAVDRGKLVSLRVPFPTAVHAVVFTPHFDMDTVHGRTLIPGEYSKEDTVYSTSRVALFVSALSQARYDLLRLAMQDRLHQPYRARLFPQMPAIIEAAIEAGAHGACLSGGGSSILALATDRWPEIGAAMRATAGEGGIEGDVRVLEIDQAGTRVAFEEPIESDGQK